MTVPVPLYKIGQKVYKIDRAYSTDSWLIAEYEVKKINILIEEPKLNETWITITYQFTQITFNHWGDKFYDEKILYPTREQAEKSLKEYLDAKAETTKV